MSAVLLSRFVAERVEDHPSPFCVEGKKVTFETPCRLSKTSKGWDSKPLLAMQKFAILRRLNIEQVYSLHVMFCLPHLTALVDIGPPNKRSPSLGDRGIGVLLGTLERGIPAIGVLLQNSKSD